MVIRFIVFLVAIMAGLLLYPVFVDVYDSMMSLVNLTENASDFEKALFGIVPLALLVSLILTPLIRLLRGGREDEF